MKTRKIAALLMAGCLVLTAGCGKKEISDDYVKISQYKGVEAEKAEVTKVTDEDVTNYIDSLLAEDTKEVTDRALKEGDIAQFDYTGKLKSSGEVFDEGTLSLGSGEAYVDGFVEGIYGHKLNEEFNVELTFPEGYGGESNPELSGADVIFTVKITSIQEKVNAELNDEVVQTLSEKSKTVEEYKKEVKETLEESNKQTAETTLSDNAWNAVLENTEVKKYPQDRLEETEKKLDEQMKMLMEQYYGVTFEEYLEQSGITEEEYNDQMKEAAKEYLKPVLASELIAQKEKLELSDKEYEKEMEQFAEENGYESKEALIETNGEDQVKEVILLNTVMDWVADNCKQTEAKEE